MRHLILIALVWLAAPVAALARPTLAIVPIDGDRGGDVEDAIAEAVDGDARVLRGKKVERALDARGRGRPSRKAIQKLARELDADLVVHGSIEKDGKRKTLELQLTRRGEKPVRLELRYKSTRSAKFRRGLREELRAQLAAASEASADDRKNKRRRLTERGDRRDDERGDRDDDRSRKDRRGKQKRAASADDTDDERPARKKKKRRGDRDRDDDDELAARDDDDDDDDDDGDDAERDDRGVSAGRHPATQVALRIHAGAAFSRRSLTYTGAGAGAPPPVGTAAPAGRLEIEVYPAAFETSQSVAARLGLVAELERTVGLSIDNIPGAMAGAPIEQGRYAIGARYRAVFGQHSFAAGVSYWRRHYIADRSALATPTALDAPDVDYSAIAPGIVVRLAATPTVGVFLGADVPLMLSAGPIQTDQSYGPADVIAFELDAGVDIALGPRLALRVTAELGQVGLTFKQKPGTMSSTRGVTNATDRLLGLAATLGVTY